MSLSGGKWVALATASLYDELAIAIGTAGDRGPDVCAWMTLAEAEAFHAELAVAIYARKAAWRDLTPIRADVVDILSHAPAEAPALLAALRAGRVDGTVYEGDCRCLVGTLEGARGCAAGGIVARDSGRPAERWFMAIARGDTPASNPVAKITETWIQEWIDAQAENT